MMKDKILDLVGDAHVGLKYVNPSTGEEISFRSEESFPSASTIKVLILLALFQRAKRGELDLGEKKSVDGYEKVAGAGVLWLMDIEKISYHDLARLMLVLSDNLATNILIDSLGMDYINDVGREYGLKSTVLARKMMDLVSKEKGLDNYTSPDDLARLYYLMHTGGFVDPDYSRLALDILFEQSQKDRLPRYLYEKRIAHKPGELDGIENDGGIMIKDDRALIIVVLCKDLEDNIRGKEIIGRIAQYIYEEG